MSLKKISASCFFSLCVSILCLVALKTNAQDMHFSQYGEAPLTLNPALCSVAYDVRVLTNYKNQWASVASPFKSYGFSAEVGIKYRKHGNAYISSGLSAYRDIAGDAQLGTTHVNGVLGAVVKAGLYSKVSGALSAGITMKSVNANVFQWENQYDGYMYVASAPSGEKFMPGNSNYADFGLGFNWNYSKSEQYISASNGIRFDVGFAAYHFNQPKHSYIHVKNERRLMKLNFYGNANIGLKGSNLCLLPGLMVSMQGPSKEIIPSFLLKYIIQEQSVHTYLVKPCAISGGLHYRYKDAIVPAVLFEYSMYAIGVSYDVNLSSLKTASQYKGGMEICLKFNWNPGYGRMLGGSYLKSTPQY